MTYWDSSDNAWLGAPAGALLRKDLSPKPSYELCWRSSRGSGGSATTMTTDAQGRLRFRGFLGDYESPTATGKPLQLDSKGRGVVEAITGRPDPSVRRPCLDAATRCLSAGYSPLMDFTGTERQ